MWRFPCDSRFMELLRLSCTCPVFCPPPEVWDTWHWFSDTLASQHFSFSPNQRAEVQAALLSLGKTLSWKYWQQCLPHDNILKTNVRHPWAQDSLFHANLSRECLVGFLGREISTAAYGRLQYFPLRVGDAFRCRVSQVISYKFTVLLLSVYLPLIINGMPFGRASLCAWRHAICVLVHQIKTGRLSFLFIYCVYPSVF